MNKILLPLTAAVAVAAGGFAWYGLAKQTVEPTVRLATAEGIATATAQLPGAPVQLDRELEARAVQVFVTREELTILGPDSWTGPRSVLAHRELDPTLFAPAVGQDDDHLAVLMNDTLRSVREVFEGEVLDCEPFDEDSDVERCERDEMMGWTPLLFYLDAEIPWGAVPAIVEAIPTDSFRGVAGIVIEEGGARSLFWPGWDGSFTGMPSRDWKPPADFRARPQFGVSFDDDEVSLLAAYHLGLSRTPTRVEVAGKCHHPNDRLEWLLGEADRLESDSFGVVLWLHHDSPFQDAVSLRERVGYVVGDMRIGVRAFWGEARSADYPCAPFDEILDTMTREVFERYPG